MSVPDDQPICKKHAERLTKKIALAAHKYALTCSDCRELILEKAQKEAVHKDNG